MEPAHKKILIDKYSEWTGSILTTPILLSYLLSKKTLLQDHKEQITNEYINPTKSKKASALLDELFKRGPQAFPTLVEGLVESDQGHIADLLDKTIADSYRATKDVQLIHAVQPVNDVRGSNAVAYVVQPSGEVGEGDAAAYDAVDATNPEMIFNVQNASPEAIKINLTDRYPMCSDPRGRAIIVNVENFKPGSGKSDRIGSSVDRNNLKKLCEQLHFTVDIWDDPTREEFIQRIKLEKANEYHSKSDTFMMFIMSHGSEGVFYTVEGESVNITQEVINQFNGKNCQQLVGKPKMFFIQACQGNSKTLGVVPDGGLPIESQPETKADTADSRDTFLKQATHEEADVLVTYSTVEGYESYRDKQKGTWFVRDLVKVFAACAHYKDVSRMVIKVTGFVDKHPEYKYKQVCVTKGSLKREIYLLPGFCDTHDHS